MCLVALSGPSLVQPLTLEATYGLTQREYESRELDTVSWLTPASPFGTTKLIWHRPRATRPENTTAALLPPAVTVGMEQSPVPHAITASPGFAGVKPAAL